MVKMNEIYISNREDNYAEVLEKADEFFGEQGVDHKSAIRLRLVVEETIGMIRAMAGEFNAKFWIERDDDEFRLMLMGKTNMDKGKKSDLLSVSSTGANASARGFMGKIGEIIENGLLSYDDVMKLEQKYVGGSVNYAMAGFGMPEEVPMMGDALTWSLGKYRDSIAPVAREKESAEAEAWDELEKSIVASIAEDVMVGIKKDRVDMMISVKI